MEYIKTCRMKDIYPEVVRGWGTNGIYHHFTNDGHTLSYPIKGAEFKTPEMCVEYFNKNGGV